jgi:hypothetical protein
MWWICSSDCFKPVHFKIEFLCRGRNTFSKAKLIRIAGKSDGYHRLHIQNYYTQLCLTGQCQFLSTKTVCPKHFWLLESVFMKSQIWYHLRNYLADLEWLIHLCIGRAGCCQLDKHWIQSNGLSYNICLQWRSKNGIQTVEWREAKKWESINFKIADCQKG